MLSKPVQKVARPTVLYMELCLAAATPILVHLGSTTTILRPSYYNLETSYLHHSNIHLSIPVHPRRITITNEPSHYHFSVQKFESTCYHNRFFLLFKKKRSYLADRTPYLDSSEISPTSVPWAWRLLSEEMFVVPVGPPSLTASAKDQQIN